MKSIFTLTRLFLAFVLLPGQSKAQLPDGSIAPDFTFADINGTSWNLYSLLAQGKTVFIDVSATWCSPCWGFHESHTLRNLYNNYGPGSTNELMVLFIEPDPATGLADLQGQTSSSMGNWLQGTPYPVINLNATEAPVFENNYQITGYPTLYMVCPDKLIRSWYAEDYSWAYNEFMKKKCFAKISGPDASLHNSDPQKFVSCDSVNPVIKLFNYSIAALSSAKITYNMDGLVQKVYNWTGNLPTYGSATITGVKLQSSLAGNHKITITVSNPNSGTDANHINDTAFIIPYVRFSSTGGIPVAESFSGTTFPPMGWGFQQGTIFDKINWAATSYGNPSQGAYFKMLFNYMNDPQFSPTAGNSFFLATQNLSSMTNPKMTFDLAKARLNEYYFDNLKVKVSVNCGSTWTTVYNKTDNSTSNTLETVPYSTYPNEYFPASNEWRNETVNLSAFANNAAVLIKFEVAGSGNNLYLDNINVSQNNSIEKYNPITYFDIYPNPASSEITLNLSLTKSEDITASIYNNIGQLVQSEQLNGLQIGDSSIKMPVEKLPAGIYTMIVSSKDGLQSKKFIISKN